jgi:hypothetical protein
MFSRRSLRRSSLYVLGVVAAAGCVDLFGPGSRLHPELASLSLQRYVGVVPSDGIITLTAYPVDETLRLGHGQRVPVVVQSSGGDLEQALLWRRDCPPRERGPGFFCFQFVVYMRDGHQVSEVADEARRLGARVTLSFIRGNNEVWASSKSSTVYFFTEESPVAYARKAHSWPGVWFAVLSSGGCQEFSSPNCGSRAWMFVPVPADTGAAVPWDGVVQFRSGDTISAVYDQPSGGRLTAQLVIN